MQTLSLSPELCSRIVSFLAPPAPSPTLSSLSLSPAPSHSTPTHTSNTLSDLLALSLTCKAFQREAEPHLYSAVVLSDPQRVLGFARAVLENERLAGWVRVFVFNQGFLGAGVGAGGGGGGGRGGVGGMEEEDDQMDSEGVNLGQDFWTVVQLILEAIQWTVEVLVLSDSSAGNTFVFDPPARRVRRHLHVHDPTSMQNSELVYWTFPALHTLKLRFTWDTKCAGFVARLACPPSLAPSSSPASLSSPHAPASAASHSPPTRAFAPSSSKLKILHFHDTTDTILAANENAYPDWSPGRLPPGCIPRNVEVFDGSLGVGVQLLPPPPGSSSSASASAFALPRNGEQGEGEGAEGEGMVLDDGEDGYGGEGEQGEGEEEGERNPYAPLHPFPAAAHVPPPTSSKLTHLQMVMDIDSDYAIEELEARLAYLSKSKSRSGSRWSSGAGEGTRAGEGRAEGREEEKEKGGFGFGLNLRALSLLDVPDDPVLVRGLVEVVGLYVPGIRHLGVLPYEQGNRHKFLALLLPLTKLHTLELDLSSWQPALPSHPSPPIHPTHPASVLSHPAWHPAQHTQHASMLTHPAAQRAIASELHTFCPSLRRVVLWVGGVGGVGGGEVGGVEGVRGEWVWVCPDGSGIWAREEDNAQLGVGDGQGRGGNGKGKARSKEVGMGKQHQATRIYPDVSAQYGGPMGSWCHRVDVQQSPQFSTTWCGA